MYDGLEIDVLSLGNADSILVTSWQGYLSTRVLIDGGCKTSVSTVRGFLANLGVTYIDHLVSTHPHDDHICGLVELVNDTSLTFGKVWVHCPRLHVNINSVDLAVTRTEAKEEAKRIRDSMQMADELLRAVERRRIPLEEPFQGKAIGFLTVCGPSAAYYEELLAQFADPEKIRALESQTRLQDTSEKLLEVGALLCQLPNVPKALFDCPETCPENNSSVILATVYQQCKYVFTGDAGAQALTHAAGAYDLSNCNWLQIPHHGSRRNITASLIEYFRPSFAYVSASGEGGKHPRRAVVETFKKVGAKVFSTHYPERLHLRHFHGNVPTRVGYTNACSLWDAPERATSSPSLPPPPLSLLAAMRQARLTRRSG
jgi:beta-lactamase superfamily II metal-dependent hydrolase